MGAQEFVTNLLSAVWVIIGIAAVVALLAIFFWAKGFVMEVETRGSIVALSEKILSAPCINLIDSKKTGEKFIFNQAALDANNNSAIPCVSLPGSFYFLEIASGAKIWHFSNKEIYPYAYNTLARGITKTCISDRQVFPFSTAKGFKISYPSPFLYKGAYLRYSALIRDRESLSTATVGVIIDPDSGTEFYQDGYPLCLSDVPCPYSSCVCSKDAPKPREKVASGSDCS